MFGAEKGTADKLDGKKLHIGIVQARFNESITNTLASACLAELKALGVQEKNITHVKVPGALEVPVALQAMAESDSFDALIALGCIIRGETYHFELVANIALGVLTRAAPQLNLFAVGFPITLTAGFIGVLLIMSNFAPVLQSLFERSFDTIGLLLDALAPRPAP